MAKKRKTARKAKAKTRTIKRKIAASSARGVKRKTKTRRVKASKSLAGRMVDAVKEAAGLRTRLTGHETFED